MRAAGLMGPRDIRVTEAEAPVAGPGEVLLRPLFTGLCGSDLHVWESGPLPGYPGPMILGHEFSAEIIAVGPAVTDDRLARGTLVAVEPMWTCGQCGPCRRGEYNLCRAMVWHGLSEKSGGLADRTVVRADMVHPLPAGLDARHGALVEPLSVAHHAVSRCRLDQGGSALILGAGPIGVAVALDLWARGVRRILVCEPSVFRRRAVRAVLAAVGADAGEGAGAQVVVMDPTEADVAAKAAAFTGGEGVEAVIDAAGVEEAFQAGLAALRPGGRMVTVAVYLRPVTFHPLTAFLSEIDVLASCGYRNDFPEVISLMAKGCFPLDGWLRTVGLESVGEAFERLHAGNDLKVLVDLTRP